MCKRKRKYRTNCVVCLFTGCHCTLLLVEAGRVSEGIEVWKLSYRYAQALCRVDEFLAWFSAFLTQGKHTLEWTGLEVVWTPQPVWPLRSGNKSPSCRESSRESWSSNMWVHYPGGTPSADVDAMSSCKVLQSQKVQAVLNLHRLSRYLLAAELLLFVPCVFLQALYPPTNALIK
jgi:hypothetical protein